jgi:hypothetical protein
VKLSDEELAKVLGEHEEAARLIDAEDAEFLAGLSADEIIEQYRSGATAIMALREETTKRVEDAERFAAEKAELSAKLNGEPKAETTDDEPKPEDEDEKPAEDGKADDAAETPVEPEAETEPEVSDPVKDKVLVTASADVEPEPEVRPMRRAVPAPAADRVVVNDEPAKELAFVASGMVPALVPGTRLATRSEIGEALTKMVKALGKPTHAPAGREERYLVASLDYSDQFPEERHLRKGDLAGNADKVSLAMEMFNGSSEAAKALVASGGFCAPLEPIYTMPQLASRARPVRDGLPNFRAERGGINVPTPTTIGDATGAITVITAEEDALGGTFATKACLDLDCPDYTETAVTIISHCREFGNLNAMAWPEKIAHENELTMAEQARVAEGYLLDRIKALSINVTAGADTLGALIYVVDAVAKSKFGIRSRLRLPNEARFQAFLPRVLLDMLEVDTISTQFDRYRSQAAIEDYLSSVGIDVTWYMDTPSTGTSQIADSAQTAAAVDGFPANIQAAVFPAGTFLHLDMAELNLGIVRDSTLNSTNDFQVFGETFENVARIGPEQAAYWLTLNVCPTGQFPPAGTARTCE